MKISSGTKVGPYEILTPLGVGGMGTETNTLVFQVKTSANREASTAFVGFAGRSRWMPDGKGIAYIDQNEAGLLGVFLQEFVPGKDTHNTRRAVAGFNPSKITETFGVSSDGSFITVAELEVLSNLVLAENVPSFKR